MFHMLRRFAFTSSLSRRSSPGFRVGPTRFGFCCCERGLLSVFTISVPIHPSFAIQSCRLGLSVAMFHDTHMGPFLRNHTLAEPGGFSHPHDSPPGQKCGIRGRRVDRALFSRNAVSKALTQTSGLEDDNGNHTDDTSRLSHHTKSLNLAHREKNVRHGWRRFYLRALWTCHLGGFRSFDRQRQSCLSVRRL
jgi:hypothetical protein